MAAVIFLLFGVGGLLVAAGWFGRRLDNHPWCVKCGHDLFGVSDSTRCAECGADLTRRRATRRGHWRKRRPLIAFGALLLVACAVLTAGETWGWAQTVEWEQHKPMWWLMRSVRADAPETRRSALEELLRRAGRDEVSADRLLELAEMGLACQNDESIEWEPLWGSMIDAAIDGKLLCAEQIGAYFENAVTFELMLSPGRFSVLERWNVRYQVSSGAAPTAPFASSQWDSVELNLIAQWNRAGAEGRYYESKCDVLSVLLGDVAIPESLYRDPVHLNSITLGSGYGYAQSIAPLIPVVVPPGEYEVRASIHIEIFANRSENEPLHTLDLRLSAPVTVTPAAPDAVEIVIDEESSQLVREAAHITVVGYRHLPTHADPQQAAPGLICSVSTGERGWFGFGDAGANCPLNANLDISVYAGGVYVETMSVSLPNSSTFNHVSAPDLTSLDLIVRPSINSRSTGVFNRRTGKPKPRWMGPEFTVRIDNVQWYDSIDDPACPPEHREMIQRFVEMRERRDGVTRPNR